MTSELPSTLSHENRSEAVSRVADLVAAPVVACLLLGGADLIVGVFRSGPSLTGLEEHAVLGISVLAHVALAGLVLALCAWLLLRMDAALPRATTRSAPASLWIFAIALIAGFVVVNLETFEGAQIREHRWHDVIVWSFRILGGIGIVAGLFLIHRSLRRAAQSRAPRRVLIVAAMAVAIACQIANSRMLVGLYPMLHTQLVALALAGWTIAASAFLGDRSRLVRISFVLAGILVLAGVACRYSEVWPRTATAAITRGPATAEIAIWTDPVFSALKAQPARIDGLWDTDLTALLAAKSPAEIQVGLDALLPSRRRMNILWIALDTVRADRVSFNGYKRKTTPRLDQLAANAFVFKRAYSSYPTSNYSYASVLTGLSPRSTPLYSQLNKTERTFAEDVHLPSILTRNGWLTAGVTAFDKVTAGNREWFGMLADGFQIYNPDQTEATATGKQITTSTLGVINRRSPQPFFVWAHYMDPHAPYQVWPEFNFGSSISDAYDSEIAFCDREVGKLLDHLKEIGEAERTMVVVFSDHGEEFEEHNGLYHNTSVYEQQIHIPLLLYIPGLKGRSVDVPVSLTDLVPTTLSLLGIADQQARHGRDLVPLLLDPSAPSEGIAYSEFFGIKAGRRDRDLRTVISGRHKLIRHVQQDLFELYDLGADALERNNLIGKNSSMETKMRGMLAAWDTRIDSTGSGAPVVRTPTFIEELRTNTEAFATANATIGIAAFVQIKKSIFDYTMELTSPAAQYLGAQGLDRYADELVERWRASADPAAKQRLLWLIFDLARPSTREFLREQFRVGGGIAFRAALALARLQDDVGREGLRAQLAAELAFDRRESAIGLAHLGDPLAWPWAYGILTNSEVQYVCMLIEALPRIGIPHLGLFIRDYVTQGSLDVAIQAKLVGRLAPLASDPDARWLMLRAAHDGEPIIREAGRRALKDANVSDDEIAAARDAVTLELDGDLAITNRMYEHAFARYREAVDKSPTLNAGLRLRFARHLHAHGKLAEAREMLVSIGEKSPNELDRAIASRGLQMLDSPARFKEHAAFAAEVSAVQALNTIQQGLPFMCTFMLKNSGTTAWQGGYWQFPNVLRLEWVGADGKRLDTKEKSYGLLPATGVLPGETVSIHMMAFAPPAPVLQATPVITFTQMESALPLGTEIYRRATAVSILVPPTGAAPKGSK